MLANYRLVKCTTCQAAFGLIFYPIPLIGRSVGRFGGDRLRADNQGRIDL